MGAKNKNSFQKWFSLSRHLRRFGAKKIYNELSMDFKNLKKQIISDGEIIYTHGSSNSINGHIDDLRKEFSGQSELCFLAAKLIVLIRREFKIKENFKLFEDLWEHEDDYLLKNLNTRWLIASSDTFSDYSRDEGIKGLSIASACLINTIKLQESERFLYEDKRMNINSEKMNKLNNHQRFPLFDGLSVFKFGTDDTIRNMRWRLDRVSKENVAGKILLEVFLRLQEFDTTYKRARKLHTRKQTRWW